MQRVTISIDDALLTFLDGLCERNSYGSRSEAVRDLVHLAEVDEHRRVGSEAPCVATLTYAFEHHSKGLARRLTDDQHQHLDISIATMHVHLNHDDCLEVAVLRGTIREVQGFADWLSAQKGVRHGHLHIVPQGP